MLICPWGFTLLTSAHAVVLCPCSFLIKPMSYRTWPWGIPAQAPADFVKTLFSPAFPEGTGSPASAKVTESKCHSAGLCCPLSGAEQVLKQDPSSWGLLCLCASAERWCGILQPACPCLFIAPWSNEGGSVWECDCVQEKGDARQRGLAAEYLNKQCCVSTWNLPHWL